MTAVKFQSISKHLREFDSRFPLCLDSAHSEVIDLVKPFLSSSGKRIRPALVFLTAGLANSNQHSKHYLFAEVTELIHTASLLHDDVIDAASIRRHQPTFNDLWGNDLAILAGDLLYIHALSKMTHEELILREAVHHTVMQMTQAELLQGLLRFKIPTYEDYFHVISGKTAALISLAGYLGAWHGSSGIPAGQFQVAGQKIGQAFQIIDDLLDFTSTENTGKSRFQDLNDGRITLPVILLLKSLSGKSKMRLLEVLTQPELCKTPNSASMILNLLHEHSIPEAVHKIAKDLIQSSLESFRLLPESPFKSEFISLTKLIINRDH